jgi:hypothetical protein
MHGLCVGVRQGVFLLAVVMHGFNGMPVVWWLLHPVCMALLCRRSCWKPRGSAARTATECAPCFAWRCCEGGRAGCLPLGSAVCALLCLALLCRRSCYMPATWQQSDGVCASCLLGTAVQAGPVIQPAVLEYTLVSAPRLDRVAWSSKSVCVHVPSPLHA